MILKTIFNVSYFVLIYDHSYQEYPFKMKALWKPILQTFKGFMTSLYHGYRSPYTYVYKPIQFLDNTHHIYHLLNLQCQKHHFALQLKTVFWYDHHGRPCLKRRPLLIHTKLRPCVFSRSTSNTCNTSNGLNWLKMYY